MKRTATKLIRGLALVAAVTLAVAPVAARGADGGPGVEPGGLGQALGANALRVIEALGFLGAPLPEEVTRAVEAAAGTGDAAGVQAALDPLVLCEVSINPELRVSVVRGPGPARIAQSGFTPALVKVLNGGVSEAALRVSSPQAGPVYAGAARGILERQQQVDLIDGEAPGGAPGRFLEVEMFARPPMTRRLSGLAVEYVVALVYSAEAGKREATLAFDIGQGTQDIGFRGEVPVLFDVAPAVPVRLRVRDHDGTPTTARLTVRDLLGRIHPPQAKRLAPDFFFQPHIYRADGESVLLTPGEYTMRATRGPEYAEKEIRVSVPEGAAAGPQEVEVEVEILLERWIDPGAAGFVSGDHHIHAAGCSHYEAPTEGVLPEHMFAQVKGEGLNVGCVLTWGPCYEYQRQFFAPATDGVSEPRTLLKYDVEVSGFGSAALGHVCLLNLRDQTYPGSGGSKEAGWPTWTVPVMRWAKDQGGVTGYPHSDLFVDPPAYAARAVAQADEDGDGAVDENEAGALLLPAPFASIDLDGDGRLRADELERRAGELAEELPNLVPPAMNGAGAMEIFVSVPEGVCDFTSAMNTARTGEWNTWYHLLNCGFDVKLAGETDFPCMSSLRVGQGRTYVRTNTAPDAPVDFGLWCRGLADGRSYVSDGYAHALEFTAAGARPGEGPVELDKAGVVTVVADVAFAPELPEAVAYGTAEPAGGNRDAGDTRVLHGPRRSTTVRGAERLVELVRNGEVVASQTVLADGESRRVEFQVPVDQSSWIALRHFPQLHTNPVVVTVAGRPVRASAESARWCAEAVELLWDNRHRFIAEPERPTARAAYDRAAAEYEKRGREAVEAVD